MSKRQPFFYSEGYIYQALDTICELYGNEIQQKEAAKPIVNILNAPKWVQYL